jgi:hypothetical protein
MAINKTSTITPHSGITSQALKAGHQANIIKLKF